MPKSFKFELMDRRSEWLSNDARFATIDEAESAAKQYSLAWSFVIQSRVFESDDPVNRRWDAKLKEVRNA